MNPAPKVATQKVNSWRDLKPSSLQSAVEVHQGKLGGGPFPIPPDSPLCCSRLLRRRHLPLLLRSRHRFPHHHPGLGTAPWRTPAAARPRRAPKPRRPGGGRGRPGHLPSPPRNHGQQPRTCRPSGAFPIPTAFRFRKKRELPSSRRDRARPGRPPHWPGGRAQNKPTPPSLQGEKEGRG